MCILNFSFPTNGTDNYVYSIILYFRCPQIQKPYLHCLHASPVTCVKMYESCSHILIEALKEVAITNPPGHDMQWPAMGGCIRASDPSSCDILVTGYVDMYLCWKT